ncbi:MAG: hypothetical protein IT308_08850 [Anaerolineaceae bacterium]|nr:hypothetical protein [Anaerolineaceae bacterium]
MKKILTSTLTLILVLLIFSACTAGGPDSGSAPTVVTAPEATATFPPLAASATPEVRPTTYKESMLPFEQLVPGDRIVILQNTINYGREGFYTPETKPAAQTINFNGKPVEAYPMSYPIGFLKNGLTGSVKVFNTGGSEQEISAEEFAGLYIIIDFTSDIPPVLYNPKTGAQLEDFQYASTLQGEAIYSVVSASSHNTKELLAKIGWDPAETYRYVATDKFYIPVGAAEVGTGEVRGTLSGAVNGSFPDLKIASGKINDVIYIEVIEN